MKRIVSILVLTALLISCVGLVSAVDEGQDVVALVKDGQAEYTIVYNHAWGKEDDEHMDAMAELSAVVERATGTPLEIRESMDPAQDKEIYIGQTQRVRGDAQALREAEGVDFSFNEELIGKDGFVIRTAGSRFVIIGGSPEATWDAIAYFVSECMGYDVNGNVESVSTLTVPAMINVVQSEYFSTNVQVALSIGDTDISAYRVIVPDNADDDVLESANTIRRAVFALTGKEIALGRDTGDYEGNAILVGPTVRYDASGVSDGTCLLKMNGGDLVIAGSDSFAIRYATDRFLSDYLRISGSVYCGDSVLKVPKDLDEAVELPFERFVAEGLDYSAYIRDTAGALLDTKDAICYSDPTIADRLYEALNTISPKAGDEVFLVSNTSKHCTCDICKGETTAFFETVNRVAEKFAPSGVTVSTLAYRETRAPSVERMAENVRVYFAEPLMCCAHSLRDDTCEANRAVRTDLEAWTKTCSDVYVLDFSQNYYSYPSTFPDFGILQPNISLYKGIGVRGVLMAWEKNSATMEFGEMRLALANGLLNNPTMTTDEYEQFYKDTVRSLYPKHADEIMTYIRRFNEESMEHFTIMSRPAEILPIPKNAEGGYDLSLAKEFGQLWEDIYERHDPPTEEMSKLQMRIFNNNYISSDYYLALHSRVQFTTWIEANIPVNDRTDAFHAIIDNFRK